METVSFEVINRIRHHINREEKQGELFKELQQWFKLTSALDVLEDSSCAVEYYCDMEYPVDIKGKYLFTYGLLQALFLQQDAIISISQALFGNSINYKKDYPEAYKVRELRNDVVGHPTNRGGNRFIYLAQVSMEKESFYYIDEGSDNESKDAVTVDVFAAINDSAKCINNILKNSLDALDAEFREYIDEHRERKMKDIFNNLGYAKEKVMLNTTMKDWGYNATKDMVKKYEDELKQRYGSLDSLDTYKYLLQSIYIVYDLIDHGLPHIPTDLRSNIEKCLLENLFTKLSKLKSYCAEIDEYFENYEQSIISDNGTTMEIVE